MCEDAKFQKNTLNVALQARLQYSVLLVTISLRYQHDLLTSPRTLLALNNLIP